MSALQEGAYADLSSTREGSTGSSVGTFLIWLSQPSSRESEHDVYGLYGFIICSECSEFVVIIIYIYYV